MLHALFVHYQPEKKFRCPASIECIKEYIRTVEIYAVLKNKATKDTQTVLMNLTTIMLSGNKAGKNIYCMII